MKSDTGAADPYNRRAMVYRFGEFEMAPDRYELRRRGRAVSLEPRVFEVLAYLVAQAGRVVTKDELLARIWPGQVVSEWSVTRAVHGVRRALASNGHRDRWIRTVYGRGFVFEGPAQHAPAALPPPAAAEPAPAIPSVAVLPFTDLSPRGDQGYFCGGLAQELVEALARIDGLAVASLTSTFSFRGVAADIRTIAARTNVATVLEGTVRKEGGRLRVSVQLVNAADNYRLWSSVFDKRVEDVFAIQEEIAASVAGALRVVLTDRDGSAGFMGKRPADLSAYDAYLRGRRLCGRPSGRALEAARQFYLAATESDPSYAPAWAGVADCAAFLWLCWGGAEADLAVADDASRRAVRLGRDVAEAHVARAQYHWISGREEPADAEFKIALRLKPGLAKPHYLYARFRYACGALSVAAAHAQRAELLVPDDEQPVFLHARILDHLGRREAAAEARRRGVRLAEQRLSHHPDDARALYLAAGSLVALGRRKDGLEWAERALAVDPEDQMALVYAAGAFARAGRGDRALTCLERAVRTGFRQRSWLTMEPDFATLRRLPRFKALVAAGRARLSAV